MNEKLSSSNLQKLFLQAVAFHQNGNLAAAEPLYLKILSNDASNFAARHMLGFLRIMQGKYAEAVQVIDDALKIHPNVALALIHHGDALMALGRLDEALLSYNRALELNPDMPQVLYNRGRVLQDLKRFGEALIDYDSFLAASPNDVEVLIDRGMALAALKRYDAALASYDKLLVTWPDHVETLNSRGVALRNLKRFDEALVSFDKALTIAPRNSHIWNNRGNVLQDLEQFADAMTSYKHALEIRSRDADALTNLGNSLQVLGRVDEALASYNAALAIEPDHVATLNNRGNAQAKLQRADEALASYDKALLIDPVNVEALVNRGHILYELRRFDEALVTYDKAISLDPTYADAYVSKGCTLLITGEFRIGWRLYEWRKQLKKPLGNLIVMRPAWAGKEDIRGKRLLVHSEQGLGDTIQFCRYLPLLEKAGTEIIFFPQGSLCRLMTGLGSSIRLVDNVPPLIDFDYHCSLLSLPLALNTEPETIPSGAPYLDADPERVERWRRHIGPDGFKIGISWRGSDKGATMHRSFALLELKKVSHIPGVRLISLQKGNGSEEVPALLNAMTVESLGDAFDSDADAFMDTAAVMKSLDLVITADTSIAHLAGALGVRTWLALKYVPDWRWLMDRSDSPWYRSVQLFRQKSQGNWSGVFVGMEAQVRRLVLAEAGKTTFGSSSGK